MLIPSLRLSREDGMGKGKGKASAPYEFGVKVSIVTTNARTPDGQFVLHAKGLARQPAGDGVESCSRRLDGADIVAKSKIEQP